MVALIKCLCNIGIDIDEEVPVPGDLLVPSNDLDFDKVRELIAQDGIDLARMPPE